MKYLLVALLIVSVSYAADAKKKSATTSNKQMSELGKIDGKTLDLEPKAKTDEVSEDTALVMHPNEVKMTVSCKAKDGHEIKQGEAGYDDCLQKMKNDKKNPHAPNADLKVDFKK